MSELEIFQRAYAIDDPEERKRYLAKACGHDDRLRLRLDELIAATEQGSDFLSVPANELIDTCEIQPETDDPSSGPHVEVDLVSERFSERSRARVTDNTQKLAYLQPSSYPDSLGSLGHYEIVKQIGQGGFGTVFKAFDQRLKRSVAVKVLAPDLAAQSVYRQRFVREARSAAAVKHPHIVLVYEVEEQPLPYIVMELVEGPTLQQHYDAGQRFTVGEIVTIGHQIAGALAVAHAQSLVHRDIKPGNILIESSGDHSLNEIKITDFGLARMLDDDSLTRSGMISGTPMYMSPEQTRGESLDGRADLFSFGSVLYMLATGCPPYQNGSTLDVMRQVARSTPAPIHSINPTIPSWLCDVISKLQARHRNDRFESAAEVESIFTSWLQRQHLLKKLQRDSKEVSGVALPADNGGQRAKFIWSKSEQSKSDQSKTIKQPVIPRSQRSAGNAWWIAYAVVSTGFNALLCTLLLRPAVPTAEPADNLPLAQQQVSAAVPTPVPTLVAAPELARAPFSAQQASDHQQRWAKYLDAPLEMMGPHNLKFKLIPPGQFLMGTSDKKIDVLLQRVKPEDTFRDMVIAEVPQHQVTIPQPFYLAACEVTQSQYFAVAKNHPSRFSCFNFLEWRTFLADTKDFPVERVSWNDAIEFCNRLSESEGLETVYKIDGDSVSIVAGDGYRLPSEAEWEFACRAGTAGAYWCGETFNQLNNTDWFRNNDEYEIKTRKVGMLASNPFGLYDLHGNVSEWVEDLGDQTAYSSNAHLRATMELPIVFRSSERTARGGSYLQVPNRCRSAQRYFRSADKTLDSMGIRLARSVPARMTPSQPPDQNQGEPSGQPRSNSR